MDSVYVEDTNLSSIGSMTWFDLSSSAYSGFLLLSCIQECNIYIFSAFC